MMQHAVVRFIGAGRRDDRRRCRLAVDEPLAIREAAANQDDDAFSDTGGYAPSDADRDLVLGGAQGGSSVMDGPFHVTKVIPRANRTYWIIGAAGTAVIALLVLLYASWAQWNLLDRLGFVPSDGRVEALDLDGEGSLAVWYSSALLFLAGQAALLVGWVQSHRPDDYAGRYRIWFWAAACWIGLSLDETASLHEAFKEAVSAAVGTRIFGDGSIWWAGPYFVVLAVVGLKLFWEMRSYWLSSMLLQATGWVWALAVATQLGLLLPETGARGVMVEEAAEMLGALFLLLSMLLHARFVTAGQARDPAASTPVPGNESKQSGQKSQRIDPPAESQPPRRAKRSAFSRKK